MSTDEVKNEIEDILSRNGFLSGDAEDFFNAMNDMLMFMAEETEKAEPHATRTIAAYRESAMSLGDYNEIIEGLASEEDSL